MNKLQQTIKDLEEMSGYEVSADEVLECLHEEEKAKAVQNGFRIVDQDSCPWMFLAVKDVGEANEEWMNLSIDDETGEIEILDVTQDMKDLQEY